MGDVDVEALRGECVRFVGAALGWRSRASMTGDDKLHEFAQQAGAIAMALNAVLDLHKPLPDDVDVSATGLICSCLPDGSDPHISHDYPCPTMLAIAEKLHVEVDGG